MASKMSHFTKWSLQIVCSSNYTLVYAAPPLPGNSFVPWPALLTSYISLSTLKCTWGYKRLLGFWATLEVQDLGTEKNCTIVIWRRCELLWKWRVTSECFNPCPLGYGCLIGGYYKNYCDIAAGQRKQIKVKIYKVYLTLKEQGESHCGRRCFTLSVFQNEN